MEQRIGRWGWVIVAAAGLAAYHNSFAGVFVFDDHSSIVDNDWLRRPEAIIQPFHGPARPFGTWTFAVNYAIGGLDSWGYHAVNLAIHLAAAVVLWDLIRRTLSLPRFAGRYADRAAILATLAAALWVVHPLTTQAVTYVVQRYESLMGLFFLLTVYSVLRGATANGRVVRVAFFGFAVAACYLGMLTKQVMVVAPVVALVYDRVFLAGSWRELLRNRWLLHLALMASAVVLVREAVFIVAVPADKPVATLAPEPADEIEASSNGPDVGFANSFATPLEYLATQAGVVLHYLRLAVVPHPLCFDYDWPVARTVADIGPPAVGIASLLTATGFALIRWPALGFLGVWFFGILAVTSSFLPIKDIAFEHRMYLSLIAVVVLLVLAGDALVARMRWPTRWGVIAAVLAIGGLSGLTILRNQDYQDEAGLWRTVVAVCPDNPRAYGNIGYYHARRGEIEPAIAAYREVIRLRPNEEAHNNLGALFVGSGRPTEAVPHFRDAVAIIPDSSSRRRKLAAALRLTDQFDDAEAECREAIRLNPSAPEPRALLADLLLSSGRTIEGVAACREWLKVSPEDSAAWNNLGSGLTRLGQLDEAERALGEAIRRNPDSVRAATNLGILAMHRGRPAEAVEWFHRTASREPGNAIATAALAQALIESGRTAEGHDLYRRCDRLDTSWSRAVAATAWRMATHPDASQRYSAEALRLGRQAVQATGEKEPGALDVLAAAEAEAGQFEQAATTARRAVEIARASGNAEMAGTIRERLREYEARRPFRKGE